MALSLEKTLSKAEILERYLNLVAFGPSQYGAEAASQWFFGVSADRLTLAQAALLAGMVNNPPKYNPLDENHVQDARDRRDLVLDVMVADRPAVQGDRRGDQETGPRAQPESHPQRLHPGRTIPRPTGSSASTPSTTWPRPASTPRRSRAAAGRSRPRWTRP